MAERKVRKERFTANEGDFKITNSTPAFEKELAALRKRQAAQKKPAGGKKK